MGASLAEELSSALDGVELPSGDAALQNAEAGAGDAGSALNTEGAAQDAAGATGRDEQGRFTTTKEKADGLQEQGQAPAEKVGESAAGEQSQAADARAAMAPPATWSAQAKAIYAQLPDVARREIAKRERDYAMGIQQHAEKAKGYEALMAEFQPYEAMIRAENGTPQGAIRDLLKTAYMLRTGSPQQRGDLVMQVAQRFGADLSRYIGQPAQQQEGQQQQPDIQNHVQQLVQQLVAPHLQKIQQWEQGQMTAQQRQQQQMEQEIQSQIEAFQSATSEDGTPKHLYFENVKGLMSAYFANGQAQTLEQAYEMACWANPEVRSALIADQQRAAEAQRLAEAKRKAGDARSAGFNVTGQGGTGISGATQSSLRDELSSQLDAALGGARV